MKSPDSTAILDGVSAHWSADTPSPLAPEACADALDALEFAQVLALVAGHAAGPLGARRIQARRPSSDLVWIRRELAQVAEVLGLDAHGEDIDVAPVPPLESALGRLRIEGSVLEGAELVAIRRTLTAARSAAAELRRLSGFIPLVSTLAVSVPDPALERRLGEAVDDAGELLDTASPALYKARREIQAARDRLIKKLETILHAIDTGPADASVTLRNGRYVIPVRRDSRVRLDGIVHDESASAGTLFVEPQAAVELGNALRGAMAEAEREALRVLRDLTERLRPVSEELAAAHEMCVALDDLLARARYARASGARVPTVSEPGAALVLRTARHPLLLSRGAEVVPFDLELFAGERTLLISGPNAGGKTVLLKTVGLAAAMAQCGIAPPVGEGSALPVFHRMAADIGDRQSIAADLSTFSAHLVMLRRVLQQADAATLVLIDEIGSGTDPAEGGALAAAALRALTRQKALTIATTHLGALKALASQEEGGGIVNGSLQFDAERLAPTFRFQKGTPGRSYGLAIARRLGLSPSVLADAEGRVSAAERSLDALLEAAEARERRLAADQAALTDRLVEAERENARLAREAELQRARGAELASREKDAERRARTEAKKLLLAARQQVEAALAAAALASDEQAAREARRRLEDAIRLEGEALGALEESVPPPAGPAGAVAPGQRVRIAGGGTGRVLEERSDGRVVVQAGAMKMVVPREALTAIAEQPEPVHPRTSESRPSATDAPVEVDLRGLRGDEAEAATMAAVDAAVLADHPYLRIIHGMGTGVVRETVRRILSADRRVVKFDFAPRNQGGTGVTIAEFGA